MKTLLYILGTFFIISSCSTTKESGLAGSERKDIDPAVKNAIEARRYIIKLDRLYSWGGVINLKPRSNYIIVDGEKAIISAAYMGRQYDIRPIAGISMRGVARDYEVTSKLSKGKYEVKMKVGNESTDVFDVYLTISKDGSAGASVSGLRIENISYRGYVVPLGNQVRVPLQEENGMI